MLYSPSFLRFSSGSWYTKLGGTADSWLCEKHDEWRMRKCRVFRQPMRTTFSTNLFDLSSIEVLIKIGQGCCKIMVRSKNCIVGNLVLTTIEALFKLKAFLRTGARRLFRQGTHSAELTSQETRGIMKAAGRTGVFIPENYHHCRKTLTATRYRLVHP